MTGCWNCRSLPFLAKFQRARACIRYRPPPHVCVVHTYAPREGEQGWFLLASRNVQHIFVYATFFSPTIRDNKILSSAWKACAVTVSLIFYSCIPATPDFLHRSSSDALYRARYTSHSCAILYIRKILLKISRVIDKMIKIVGGKNPRNIYIHIFV